MARDLRPDDLRFLDPLTPEQITHAASLHARLRAHRGEWGHWEGGKPSPDGGTTAYYVVLAPIAQQAYDWLIDSGVLPVFDWVAWSAKRDLVRGNVSGLAPDVARALLTTLVLQHRSSDGSLLGAFRHGIITELLGVLGTHPEVARAMVRADEAPETHAAPEAREARVLEPI
ncbi:MAG: DUF6508 domain-containing protein [Candidatus Phosphoribacter baldrii]